MHQFHVLTAKPVGTGVEGNKIHFTCFPISQSECQANEWSAEPARPCLQPLNGIFQDQTLHFTRALKTVTSYIRWQTWWRFACDWTYLHVPLLDPTITSDPTIWSDHFRKRRDSWQDTRDKTNSWHLAALHVLPAAATLWTWRDCVHTLATLMLGLISWRCSVAAIRVVVG